MPPASRILMLGTGDFALPTFLHLIEAGVDVAGLVTQPDRPQGRKQLLIPSRIKVEAQSRGLPVEQPEDVNHPDSLARLAGHRPDLLVTAAYGQILSAELLGVARLGGINLHGSILPAYRGASPVVRAIENGDAETGVTVIRMTPKIDAGGMIAFARTPIDPDETAGELEARLAKLGAPLVLDAIVALEAGTATILPQSRAKVTRAPKLRKEDGQVDWSKPARAVHDHVRAMQPWPVAATSWHRSAGPSRPPERLLIHRTALAEGSGAAGVVLEAQEGRLVVAAGQGAVRILEIQLPGKTVVPIADFLRGYLVLPGDRLGTAD